MFEILLLLLSVLTDRFPPLDGPVPARPASPGQPPPVRRRSSSAKSARHFASCLSSSLAGDVPQSAGFPGADGPAGADGVVGPPGVRTSLPPGATALGWIWSVDDRSM